MYVISSKKPWLLPRLDGITYVDPIDPRLAPLMFLTTNLLSIPLQLSIFVISIMVVPNIASGVWMPLSNYMLMYESIILQKSLGM